VLSRRHDAIRCRFEEDSRGDWHQYVDPPRSDVSRSVAVHELHALAPDARDEAIKSILQEMARGARLEEGNLVRFNLFRTPGTALLNILSHHIVTDYFSLMLLKRELSQLMSG